MTHIPRSFFGGVVTCFGATLRFPHRPSRASAWYVHQGRSEVPEVKAYYTSDTLTVSITGYYGDVEVTVEEAMSGTVQTTQTEYVFGQGTVLTDITSLTSGYYVLYIRLDNDDEYVGYFSK